jgi:Mg-chelatase subunit ChlD
MPVGRMAASERMEATKGAIFSLLVDAYQRRDQVGLVVFQRDKARLVLAAHQQRRVWRSAR